jgi:hypothetical protein
MGSEIGSGLIAAERFRQIGQEHYTREHDDRHDNDELALAAVSYAAPRGWRPPGGMPVTWPWRHSDWKPLPDDRIRELAKAGALIAAEIDRLLRLETL